MNKKRKVIIKVVKPADLSIQKALDEATKLMKKSGAISDDRDSSQTALSKSLTDEEQFTITTEKYLELCKENDMVSDGSHLDDEDERKAYIEGLSKEDKAKTMDASRILTFRGSDESTDRYGDVMRVAGWDLKNYRKNPVFMLFHEGRSFPVGRAVKVWKEGSDKGAPNGKSLMFNIYFPKDNEWSDFVYSQFDLKLLNAVSVGFRASKANRPSSQEERDLIGLGPYGTEFLKQELVELSAVAVPCNQNALRVKSLDQKELAKRLLGLDDDAVEIVDSSKDIGDDDSGGDNNDEGEIDLSELLKSLHEVVVSIGEMTKEFKESMKEFNENIKSMEVTINVTEGDGDDDHAKDEAEKALALEAEANANDTLYKNLLEAVSNVNKQPTEEV